MGSGMLWAAIGGASRAGMQVMDDRVKRDDDERKRVQSMDDRKNALLFEMKAKADYARQEEDAAAEASSRIAERGAQIGNERGARELEAARSTVPNEGEFANERITPEMIAAMPPQARAIYEKEMGLTDDTELQGMRDQISASREIGAPAAIRKGLLDSYKTEVQDQQKQRELERKERVDEQRYQQGERRLDMTEAQNQKRYEMDGRRLDQQLEIANQRIDAATRRGAGAGTGTEQTEKLTVLKDVLGRVEADKPKRKDYRNEKSFNDSMDKWAASDNGQIAQQAMARMKSIFGEAMGSTEQPSGAAPAGGSSLPAPKGAPKAANTPWVTGGAQAEQVRIVQSELERAERAGKTQDADALRRELTRLGAPAQAAAQQSTKKDNATTSKAEYLALPQGARYTAPDGTTRIKG